METSTQWSWSRLFLPQSADRPTGRSPDDSKKFSQACKFPKETPCSRIVYILISTFIDIQSDDFNPIDGILSPFLRPFSSKKVDYNPF